ncbi:MAG: alpha/beta fold hydrolase [Gemmatimonadota bacterium]
MNARRKLGTILVLLAAGSAGAVYAQATAAPAASGRLIDRTLSVPALRGNRLGDPSDQPVSIYLPPSYDRRPARRYPTLYLLHGFGGRPEEWTNGYQGLNLQRTMDSLTNLGLIHEMIVVVPNGKNAYLGSFYTNSTVAGNWEDYLVRDLVGFMDSRYRTLRQAESRGIAGHSMGGYGAIMLGMKHPDVFGALYALSPCCVDLVGDLASTNPAWPKALAVRSRDGLPKDPETFDQFYTNVFVALGAAFSPDPAHGPMFVSFPYRMEGGKLVPNAAAMSAWRAKLPLPLSAASTENLCRLRGIALDFGEKEEFTHIRIATTELSQALAAKGIPHSFEVHPNGTHGSHIRERASSNTYCRSSPASWWESGTEGTGSRA